MINRDFVLELTKFDKLYIREGGNMNFKEWAKKYYPNESKETLHKMSHAWASGHTNMAEAKMTDHWNTVMYESGTHIVTKHDGSPHYYVYADERYDVCKELEAWLNGGLDPEWRKHLKRCSTQRVDGPDGIHIFATGPFTLPPNDDGALNWQVDPAYHQDRIKLIDRLLEE